MTSLLAQPKAQFADGNGKPYAGGTLATYVPGTTTAKTTWQDAGQTTPNTNPIVLDSAGRCLLYGSGQYRLILSDALGNLVYDQLSNSYDLEGATTGLISSAMLPVVQAGSTAAALQAFGYTDVVSGAGSRSVAAKFADLTLSLMDFTGADNTGTTAIDTAWTAFVTAVMTTGRPGWVPAGRYKFAYAATIDFGLAASNGGSAVIRGVLNRSILDLTGVAGAPALQITDSTGGKAAFYGVIDGISVHANALGAAVAIGLPDHSDAFNGFYFNIQIANASTAAGAIGMQVNGAYNCKFWVTANNGGHGAAFVATEMCFCEVFGAFGHADVGLHLTTFYNFGNVFHALDIEVVNTCVSIDVAQASRNTWVGGQFAWTNGSGPAVTGINATAGALNRFIGVNFGSAGAIATNQTGIIVVGNAIGTEQFGSVTMSPAGQDCYLTINADAGSAAHILFQQAFYNRWAIARNSASETGGNTGSDFVITRLADNGTSIDNPFYITRSNGLVNILNAELGAGGGKVGFYGGSPITQPTITGAKGGNAALTSLLSLLATMGLIVDGTS